MDNKVDSLLKTTFGGRQFRRHQLTEIQKTVRMFSGLSRRELAHTICERFQWKTPRGTDKIQTCLNALEEMESRGIIKLPAKVERNHKARQKKILWTDQTNEALPIDCAVNELMPINLQVVTEPEQITEWNEFVDRYHYLGYRRPIGSHLRYYVVDRYGRKLGCLLFSFATIKLTCRDEWIGWTDLHRQKHLNLIANNNRFLIFPWVNVKHLASKALAYAIQQIARDWESHHGYKPVLVETFVDPTRYNGTCYKASNWQYIGKTAGKSFKNESEFGKKDVYIYPLDPDARELLMDNKKSVFQKVAPYKTACITPDNQQVYLWQKIITVVASVAENFDKEWQQRRRVLSTLLIILFIFRLIFSKNKQGYGLTIAELWEYCHKLHIPLPQAKPVVPAAFCNARKKMDESIFKTLNTKIIHEYESDREDYRWKNHRLFAIDGSKINLPKELLNDGYQKPSDNAHFPQGMVSCLYQLKSKIPYQFELAAHLDERRLAFEHIQFLHEDDLVVYDRGYFSYALLYTHYKKKLHAVFRLPSSSYKLIKQFMESDDIERVITIMPTSKDQREILKKYPHIEFIPLQLRLIKYTINNMAYTLGTTLFDHHQYQYNELAELYHARWGIEELYKISKVLIDVEDFHGKTERGVKQELFAHFVILTLSRIFSNQTDDILLLRKGINKSDSSNTMKTNLKNCLITVARNLEGLFLRQAAYVKESIHIITESIATCYQKIRPNRSYARVSNKIPKKWKLAKKKSTKAVAVP